MKKILFYLQHEYHLSALMPIYDEFAKEKEYDLYFKCEGEKERKFWVFTKNKDSEIEKRLKERGFKIADNISGFDLVFTGDLLRNYDDFNGVPIAFVNHGSGIKNVLYRELAKRTHEKYMIFVESEYRKTKILEKQVLGQSEVYVVGMPKLDPLFNRKYDKLKFLAERHLSPDRPTILYAPTYKPTSIGLLKEHIFSLTKKYNLIVKLHPYSWQGHYAPHWHHKIFERKVKKLSNFYLVSKEDFDIVPYISVCDMVITEASSVMFEFLALDKSGVIFDLQNKYLKHSNGAPILDEDTHFFLTDSFVHIQNSADINDAVSSALQRTPEMMSAIQKDKEFLFYKTDGQASARIKQIVEEKLW